MKKKKGLTSGIKVAQKAKFTVVVYSTTSTEHLRKFGNIPTRPVDSQLCNVPRFVMCVAFRISAVMLLGSQKGHLPALMLH